MDGYDLLGEIFLPIDFSSNQIPDGSHRRRYIPYIWSKESVDIPNEWDDFSYEATSKVLDFRDALPQLELPPKFNNQEWHVVKITGNLMGTANKYIKNNPNSCKPFVKELHDYYNAMPEKKLIIALASINMSGLLLLEARRVLEKKGITFKDEEIVEMKTLLADKNKKTGKRTLGITDALLFLVLIIIVIVLIMKLTQS